MVNCHSPVSICRRAAHQHCAGCRWMFQWIWHRLIWRVRYLRRMILRVTLPNRLYYRQEWRLSLCTHSHAIDTGWFPQPAETMTAVLLNRQSRIRVAHMYSGYFPPIWLWQANWIERNHKKKRERERKQYRKSIGLYRHNMYATRTWCSRTVYSNLVNGVNTFSTQRSGYVSGPGSIDGLQKNQLQQRKWIKGHNSKSTLFPMSNLVIALIDT